MSNKSTKELFDELADRIGGIGGDIPLSILFDEPFVEKHSRFKRVEDLFADAGFSDQETFDAWLETDEAEEYVRTHTEFESWSTMASVAFMQYLQRKAVRTGWGTWNETIDNADNIYNTICVTFNVTADDK